LGLKPDGKAPEVEKVIESQGQARAHPSQGGVAKPRDQLPLVRLAASAGTSSEGSREGKPSTTARLTYVLEDTTMLARIRKAQENNEGGFTLIELLVVIIIIGILAAIAIPTFLKQREKGYFSAMQSDLKNMATAAESYATDHNGDFTGLATTDLTSNGYNQGATITPAVVSADASGYCLGVVDSRTSARSYHYNSAVGTPVEDATSGTNAC
jgi:type IV pilus assembly protein PilA